MLLQSVNLSLPKQEALRKLLDSEGVLALIEVLESRAFACECEAANCLLKSTTGYDEQAKGLVRRANAFHETIHTIRELIASKEPFTISSAKPNTKTTK